MSADHTEFHHPQPTGREVNTPEGERLQKVLAAAGAGSRRECEDLIREGRVEVDRHVVTELGVRVDPHEQQIRVDGQPLKIRRPVYYMLNKPAGVLSTNRDPSGRLRVIDLIPTEERLFPVGRLDKSSEGLLIVTNDGELANRLSHPRYGVKKTYKVTVAGRPSRDVLEKLRKGIHLAEAVVRVANYRVRKRVQGGTEIELTLDEGRNREIRRMLAKLGHKVLQLTRIAVGPVRLGDLPPGAYRKLTRDEIRALESAARGSSKRRSAKGGKSAGPPKGAKKPGSRRAKAVQREREPWTRDTRTPRGSLIGGEKTRRPSKGKAGAQSKARRGVKKKGRK